MVALKIALLWIVMVVCYALYGSYHLSELMYGVDVRAGTTGKVPLEVHLLRIVFEPLSLLFAVLSLYLNSKLFKTISYFWILLLAPVNTFQLMYSLVSNGENYSKHLLLVLILVVNIILFFEVRSWREV